jgi:hypothetical protein
VLNCTSFYALTAVLSLLYGIIIGGDVESSIVTDFTVETT